jgi:hypothetical protein
LDSAVSDKKAQKEHEVREQIAALVEPGETLSEAVIATRGPLLALGLGPFAVAFLKFRIIAQTEKAIYVMPTKATGGPKEVEQRIPLPVAVSISDTRVPRQNKLVIGDQNFNLGTPMKEEAERIAVAAASAPAAAPAP